MRVGRSRRVEWKIVQFVEARPYAAPRASRAEGATRPPVHDDLVSVIQSAVFFSSTNSKESP